MNLQEVAGGKKFLELLLEAVNFTGYRLIRRTLPPTMLLLWHLPSNWLEWCFNREKKIDLKNTCSTVFTQNSHKAWFLANPKARGEVLGSRLVALTLFGKVQIPTYSPCISKWFSLAAVVVKLFNIFSTRFEFSWLGKCSFEASIFYLSQLTNTQRIILINCTLTLTPP